MMGKVRAGLWAIVGGVGLAIGCGNGLAADAPRPAAIEVGEVPSVPAELMQHLRMYQSIRGAAFAGWDPAGNGMLIRTRFGNSAQLHRVYAPGGRREQITFFDEPCGGRFVQGTTAEKYLLAMSAGGNENNQVYVFDRNAYSTRMVTDGKSRNSTGPMREDGSQVIVSSNARNGKDTDLFLLDLTKRDSTLKPLLEVKDEFWSAADWSVDGKTILLSKYVSANESYPAVLDMESGKRTMLPLVKEGVKAAHGPMGFLPDGKSALVASDAIGEFRQLYQLSLKEGEGTYKPLTADIPWDVDELAIDTKSGQAAFTVNEDGSSRLYWLVPQNDGTFVRKTLEVPLSIIGGLEFSPDGKQLGMSLSRPDAPADVYSLELATGNVTRWTFSETGGLNPKKFVLPKKISFKSFDGLSVPAYYYPARTENGKKAPVLVMIHGGPEGQSQPYFSGMVQYFAGELGISVILPNVRGSAGYGKTYLKLDNAELREDSVKDIGALLDWIKDQPELAADKVAVSGGSYGGYMVLASLVHFGERIKAGVDIVGIANFNTFLANTASYRVDLRRVEYGDERDEKMREVLTRISPANHADKIRSALMVAHGKNDPRVPFSEAQQIAEKVRAHGRPVWTVYAENEGHGFSKKDNSDYLQAVQVMFLQKMLSP
ncbi:MAG: S9 family peptidase [Planctomycetaceae bacterium]